MTGPEAHRLYQHALEGQRILSNDSYTDHADREDMDEHVRQARAAMEFASFNHKRTR